MLYILGHQDDAATLLSGMQGVFPDLQPRNPVFYVTLKPIDDILAHRARRVMLMALLMWKKSIRF